MKKTLEYRPEDMINRPAIPEEIRDDLSAGLDRVARRLALRASQRARSKKSGTCRIALEAHLGVPWETVLPELERAFEEEGLEVRLFDLASCWRSSSAVERTLAPYLPEDPMFGRIYDGSVEDFLDRRKLASLRKKMESAASPRASGSKPRVFVLYGSGILGLPMGRCYDTLVYWDLCREEILKRLKLGLVRPFGTKVERPKKTSSKPDALPAYFSTRRLYYIDYALLDELRRKALRKMDYYVDANEVEKPKMISSETFGILFERLLRSPVKPKPYYDPGVWGGTWLKKVRKLPKDMINCAWSYDLIEPETSFQAAWDKETILEFPFPVLTAQAGASLLGKKGSKKKYEGQFPVRVNYDDSMGGDDMALQSHPDDVLIRERFNEPYRQDETYYIVDTARGAKTHLGLREDADVGEFREAVERAERDHVPFDHSEYVHSIPSKMHDLFLIPAGTIHGSGKNQNVLEISATTYRYTFHFYDFLRPGLDGNLRAIHSEEAFAALKPSRRANWVEKNLKQEPKRIRRGKGWAEYSIGARPEMFFKIHRLEFENSVRDDTKGEFHLLILVEGNRIEIRPRSKGSAVSELPFSCLAVLPASMGGYALRSVDGAPCKVVKVLMA